MKKLSFLLTIIFVSVCSFAQDIIVTKDAKKIDAKILEVSTSEIRYKELDNLDGPVFILRTDEINSIVYANGKVVLYNQPKSEEELAVERARRVEESRKQAEQEQKDINELERVAGLQERQQKEAETKAMAMGALYGKNTSGTKTTGVMGNPVGHGTTVGGGSWSLAGRGIRGTLPQPSNNFKQEGRVVIEIRVNKAGTVVNAIVKGGDITDKQTQQLALEAARKASFTEGEKEQIGTITYIFKLN